MTQAPAETTLELSAGAGPSSDAVDRTVEGHPHELGRYLVLGRLGAGATATVYRAYDPKLDRRVAIKVINRGSLDGERRLRMIVREAKALARLRHANIVSIYDARAFGDEVFIVMELVSGETLRSWLAQRAAPRGWAAVRRIFLAAAAGLHAAHEAGLIHRDFKPSNVVIADGGEPRILDFGLAIAEAAAGAPGSLVGTPAYMAPEQLLGGVVSALSDQFSFCATLFEALYGRLPFAGGSVEEISRAVIRGAAVLPRSPGPGVPRGVHRALLRGLTVEPEGRFPDMATLAEALCSDDRVRARLRRGSWTVGALVVGAGIAGGALQLTTDEFCVDVGVEVPSWSPARRVAIRESLAAASGRTIEPSWGLLQGLVDDYIDASTEVRHRACVQTRVDGIYSEEALDARMTCLDRHFAELDALLIAFGDGRTDVDVAIEALHRLPPVSECSRVAVESGGPAPESPQEHAELARVEAELVRLRVLRDLARHEEGLAASRPLVEAAREQGEPRLLADVLFYRGHFAGELDDHELAERSLWESLWLAEERGDTRRALRAAGAYLVTAGVKLGRIEEARRWSRYARQLAGRRDGANDGQLDLELASLAYYAGDFGGAADLYRKADAAIRESEGEDAVRRIPVLTGLAKALEIDDRDLAGARRSAEEALELAARSYGDAHPAHARALKSAGDMDLRVGEFDRAEAFYERALAVLDRGRGEEDPIYSALLNNLGVLESSRGSFDRALSYYRHAHELTERRLGSDHLDLNASLYNIGNQLVIKGHFREAKASYDRILEIHRKRLGELHPNSINALRAIVRLLIVSEAAPEAIATYLEWMYEIYDRELSASRSVEQRFDVLLRAAKDAVGIARPEIGRPYALGAHQLAEEFFAEDRPEYVMATLILARTRFIAGELDGAERLIAPHLVASPAEETETYRGRLRLALLAAEIAGARGDFRRAEELLRRLDVASMRGYSLSMIELLYAKIQLSRGDRAGAEQRVREELLRLHGEGETNGVMDRELRQWLEANGRGEEGSDGGGASRGRRRVDVVRRRDRR